MSDDTDEALTWREKLRLFAKTSPLHGLVQFMHSRNWFEQLLWIVFIAVCIWLTIRDVRNDVVDYLKSETTSTAMIVPDVDFSAKYAVFCIELDGERMLVDRAQEDGTSYFDRDDRESIFRFLDSATKLVEDANLPPGENGERVKIWTQLLFQMFRHLGRLETRKHDEILKQSEAVSAAYAYFVKQGRDFKQLFDVTARWLCRFMNIQFTTRLEQGAETICDEMQPLSIGKLPLERDRPSVFDKFCFRLRTPSEGDEFQDAERPRFNETHRKAYILINHYKTFYPTSVTPESFPFHDPRIQLVLNAPGGNFQNCSRHSCNEMFIEQKRVQFDIIISSVHIGDSEKNNPCESEEEAEGNCHTECAANAYLEACGCWPLTESIFHPSAEGLKLCTGASMTEIDKIAPLSAGPGCYRNETLIDSCVLQCKSSHCHSHVIFLTPSHVTPFVNRYLDQFSAGGSETIAIVLHLNQLMTLVVIEETKITINTLLSNLGGSLSLWIGGSFLSLIHVVLFPLGYYMFYVKPVVERRRAVAFWNRRIEDVVDQLIIEPARQRVARRRATSIKVETIERFRDNANIDEEDGNAATQLVMRNGDAVVEHVDQWQGLTGEHEIL